MTRFRWPRYEGTDARTVDALHDAVMDDLVNLYVALRGTAGLESNAEPSEARPEGDGTTES